jgi:membrane associated rhomboid family serine protease
MDQTTPPEELRGANEPFLRLPWPIGVLAGLMIAIEALLKFLPVQTANAVIMQYGLVPARYSASFLAAHGYDGGSLLDKALPFVTYIFLHGGWAHVIINSVWLLAFGPVVVMRLGVWRFFLFFLICGVAGAALHLVLNWQALDPVIGASAAISGLMAAAFRLIGDGRFGRRHAPMLPLFSRQILLWSAIWVIINIVAGVTGVGTGPGLQLVAWQAHLGGFFAGLLLAGLFDPIEPLEDGGVVTK